MDLDCSEVSKQLPPLLAHLRLLQRELENCTDNCDELQQEIQQTSHQIAVVEQQQSACELMQVPWNINANGLPLTLTIVSEEVFTPDEGRLSFVGWIGNDFTVGNYYYSTGQIVFDRNITLSETQSIFQAYSGYLFENPAGSPTATFAGTFTSSDSPNSTFGWFMNRSS